MPIGFYKRTKKQLEKLKQQGFKKGNIGFWKGKKFSEETKRKLSIAHIGQKSYWKDKKKSKEIIEKTVITRKKRNNYIVSKETKEKISKTLKGKSTWNKGLNKFIDKRIMKMSKKNKGKLTKEKCHFWKGGITPLYKQIRELEENEIWRKAIFERDDYTCQECFIKGGKLHAHHKNKKFSQLLQEFLQQYSQFSPIEDKETLVRLATTYKPFWDISNGITICIDCHKQTKNYLRKYG